MSNQSFLIFSLNAERFAVDAMAVKEIVWLPELTPVEEMPGHVVGVFNLRGHIVTVMDLNLRFGHPQERYSISDRVIILEVRSEENPPESTRSGINPFSKGGPSEIPPLAKGGEGGFAFGIIVNDVHDVVSVAVTDIEPSPRPHLIAGEVKVGEEIVMLLDHNAIAEFGIRNSELKDFIPHSALAIPHLENSALRIPHSAFTPEELSVFHSRAHALMQPPESLTLAGLIPLAVVGLNGEYYGVNLETVREFSNVLSVAPVPCTPPHIVGDMNLRGDILTIVDIRERLNIASAELGMRNAELKALIPQFSIRNPHLKKVVVAQINDLLAGVAVDEVVEVVNINPSDIRPVPSAVKAVSNEFISGEAPYAGKMLSILDLKKILTEGGLVVEEEA